MGLFVSSERYLPDLNDTLWRAIHVIDNVGLDFSFQHIEVMCSLILVFTLLFFIIPLFFDNIALCKNL